MGMGTDWRAWKESAGYAQTNHPIRTTGQHFGGVMRLSIFQRERADWQRRYGRLRWEFRGAGVPPLWDVSTTRGDGLSVARLLDRDDCRRLGIAGDWDLRTTQEAGVTIGG